MDKFELIKRLDKDFNIEKYQDIWEKFFSKFTENIEQYICPSFQQCSCGLMIDFTDDIKEILTTTFITENVFTYIKENNKKDLLIFTHHPYYQKGIDNSWGDAISNNIEILKNNRIAIYVCHMALDFHPKYSTAFYLAKELISNVEGRLSYEYEGHEVQCEYYGSCVEGLLDKVSKLSSRVSFYQFGETKPSKICCSPGGGNMISNIKMAKEKGADTYITGISEFKGRNSVSRNIEFFTQLQDIGISIIGMGHYETECLTMKGLVNDYFRNLIDSVSYFEDKYYE